jgi:hypothetical protein
MFMAFGNSRQGGPSQGYRGGSLSPGQQAYQKRAGLSADPYRGAKQSGSFYGPSLMKQYGGNTQVLDQLFQGLQVDQGALAAGRQRGAPHGFEAASGGGYQRMEQPVPHGWSQTGGGNPSVMGSQQWDPGQLWQLMMQMFGQRSHGLEGGF